MKEIREFLTELEKINTGIIDLKFQQMKTYQALIDRIMINCKTDIHPDVLAHLNKVKKVQKVGYWVHDIRKKLFMATRELLHFIGTDSKQESFSENAFFNLIHKDDLPRIMISYPEDLQAHKERASAYRIINLRSELKYVLSHFTCKYDDQNQPIQATGIIFEIPQDDIVIPECLPEYHSAIIASNMGVGFWEFDPKTNREYWSSSLYEIIESTPEKTPPHISSLEKLIHRNHLAPSIDLINERNNNKIDYELTFKIKTLQGNEKIVFSQVHHLVDSEGNLIKRYGLIYDVSKMKQLLIK
ncbi:PAS domain-containing protein [bacterium]|nr:PAS domain-containing protein [bacterium]